MKKKSNKPSLLPVIALAVVILAVVIYYGVKFASPSMLKAYIATGTGNCQTSPIFCMQPGNEIIEARGNKEYLEQLTVFKFDDIQVRMPKDFVVVHERVQKVYYKKIKHKKCGSSAFLLNQPPDYFIHLFPQAASRGVKTDYEFLDRTMCANLNNIKDSTDAFFVIVKGIFIPDVGNQKTVTMIRFKLGAWKGFMNYNLTPAGNYFDCNIITDKNAFLKVYIKDVGKELDLDKVFAILSSLK